MGCCQTVTEEYLIDDILIDLLKTLLLRKFSDDQMKIRLKNIYANTDDTSSNKKELKKKLETLSIDQDDKNQAIDFHVRFMKELFDKCGDLNRKNLIIFLYPLLNNNDNKSDDNFYGSLIEKFGDSFNFDEFQKELISLVEFYTYDLNNVLEDFLTIKEEKEYIKKITEAAFSKKNIKKFVDSIMKREDLIKTGVWKDRVPSQTAKNIVKEVGINDYIDIRHNLSLFFEKTSQS
jgi:hypothetical protein